MAQYGNQLILRLDGGEGKYYTESLPRDEHRLIALSGKHLFGAADVKYKKYVNTPTRTSVLKNSEYGSGFIILFFGDFFFRQLLRVCDCCRWHFCVDSW